MAKNACIENKKYGVSGTQVWRVRCGGEDGCDTPESTFNRPSFLSTIAPMAPSKTIVILTRGCQNGSNFDMRRFLSIRGPRLSRKNDPKSQNDGEFFQQKGPFLDKMTAGRQNDSDSDIRSAKRQQF